MFHNRNKVSISSCNGNMGCSSYEIEGSGYDGQRSSALDIASCSGFSSLEFVRCFVACYHNVLLDTSL